MVVVGRWDKVEWCLAINSCLLVRGLAAANDVNSPTLAILLHHYCFAHKLDQTPQHPHCGRRRTFEQGCIPGTDQGMCCVPRYCCYILMSTSCSLTASRLVDPPDPASISRQTTPPQNRQPCVAAHATPTAGKSVYFVQYLGTQHRKQLSSINNGR